MGELIFVGLGLNDDLGLSLHALEEIKSAEQVFIELYTSLLPEFSKDRLEKLTGKKLMMVTRKDLEDDDGEVVLKAAQAARTVLLVPGDPLIATTHIALRISARKQGITTQIVHGASILSAAVGLSGLHNYKFGKSVTIPFPDETAATTPYRVISENRKRGLHTLCFLDIRPEKNRCLTIKESLIELMRVERSKSEKSLEDAIVVGVARAGNNEPNVKAGLVKDIVAYDFGPPPHTLIVVGRLHFMEAEALIALDGAPEAIRRYSE